MKKWLVGLLAAGLCAATASAATVTDTLNRELTGIAKNSSNYGNWSGKTSVTEAVYAGNSAGGNDAIQLRSNNNNSGIVTTSSGGKAKKVTVTWTSTSNGRTLNVYGKNSSYSAATDLYDSSTRGALIGTIVAGTSTTLTIPDDYDSNYIGMRSDSGAMYLSKVEIDWEVAGEPGVSLDASATEVVVGGVVTITATATDFSNPVTTWTWSGNSGTAVNDGNTSTFTVDTSVADTYTSSATASDGTTSKTASTTITVTAPPPPTVTLAVSPAEEVEVGTAVTITATAANFSDEVTWTWAGDDDGTWSDDGNTSTYTVNTSAAGEYEIIAEATCGDESADATVTITVTEPKTSKTVTYTVTSKTEVSASGDVPTGSSAAYSQTYGTAKQATKDNSFTLTLSGYEGLKIVGLTLSMHSNGSSGAGTLSVTCGDATIASIANAGFGDDSWNGSYTATYTDVTPAVTATTVDDKDVVIQIAATQNSLYCESYTVEYEVVPVVFSITLDPAAVFSVEQNATATITATPHNQAEGDVSYGWTVNDDPVAGVTGNVLTLDTSVIDVYEAVCTAVDAGGATATASVMYEVIAPVAKYTVSIASGIENGTVEVDKATAAEGETVEVTATPAENYRLASITVDGTPIEGNTFEMPAKDVTVSATFKAVPTYTLVESAGDLVVGADYLIVASGSDYDNAMKCELTTTSTKRLSVEDVTVSADGKTIATDSTAIVWQLKSGTVLGQRVWYNAAASKYAAAPSANSAAAQLLDDYTDQVAQWTIDTTDMTAVAIQNASHTTRYLQRNASAANRYFAAYTSEQSPKLYRADSTEVQTVTFDPNGGTYMEEKLVMKYAVGRDYWGIWSPTWEGHKFLGWYDVATGAKIWNNMQVTEASTREVQARWAAWQTVTFDANGGTFSKESVECANIYTGFGTPTRDGYKFLGWYDALEGGNKIWNGTKVSGGATLTVHARWKKLAISSFAMKSVSVSARDARSVGEQVVELSFETVADGVYEVQWTASLDGEWMVLKTWTAEEDGETSVRVTIPADAGSGFFRISSPEVE